LHGRASILLLSAGRTSIPFPAAAPTSVALPTPAPNPGPRDPSRDNAFLAHVERVFAARPPAQQTGKPKSAVAVRPARPAAAASEAGWRLWCEGCGWAVECLAGDRGRFARRGCLKCGGPLTAGPATPAPKAPPRDEPRRRVRRRPRGGTWVEVRRGTSGDRRNLAVALVDVCEDGVGVWLTESIRPGEEVEVLLAASPKRRARLSAEVRWCAPGLDSSYRAGLRLRTPLTERAVAELGL
jgi:hypothetical protein